MKSYPFAVAQRIAEHITKELLPYCARAEIAGTIRRRRPEVEEIRLVAEPLPDQIEALKARILKTASLHQIQSSRAINAQLKDGLNLTVCLATRENWGSILLRQTGPTAFAMKLGAELYAASYEWDHQQGVFDRPTGRRQARTLMAGPCEETFFTLLGLEFVPPWERDQYHWRAV